MPKFFTGLNHILRYLGVGYILLTLFAVLWTRGGPFIESHINMYLAFGVVSLIALLIKNKINQILDFCGNKSKKLLDLVVSCKLSHLIVFGLIIRIVTMFFAETAILSDGYSYFEHAKNMLINGYFGFDGGISDTHWPPGYAIILMPFMKLFGANALAVQIANCFLFVVAVVGVWISAEFCWNKKAASLASLILVLWPNYIVMTNTSAKEYLLIALFPWVFYAYMRFTKENKYMFLALSGVLIGFMNLTQPSTAVVCAALAASHLLFTKRLIPSAIVAVIVISMMFLTTSPWSYRNAQIGEPASVTTSGGDVFYRANNASANPGYNSPSPDSPIYHLNPIDKSKLGYQLGLDWITENPLDFLHLGVRKAVLYLGNDDTGLWQLVQQNNLPKYTLTYILVHLIINFYWVFFSAYILYKCYLSKEQLDHSEIFITLCFLALLTVDFVFEAGNRHHLPLYPLMALLCAKIYAAQTKAKQDEN